ncbi:MAG: hypothetical protein IT210_06645 [Armatimonadetes bacterium]|nr:hypothetical protein [Armatimonadota bacterium]
MLSKGWLISAALPLLLSFAGKAPRPAAPGNPKEDAKASLTVVFGSEQNGYLMPCGCAKPMLGGLPRRATLIKSLPERQAVLKVDNGDLTPASGRQDEMKAETMVEILNALNYDAINLGESDFRLGLPYLESLRKRFKGAFLCANARKADDTPLFQEYTAVQKSIAGKPVRAAVVGLLSEQYGTQVKAAGPGILLKPPAATLERLKARLEADSPVRILLYHGPKAEAERLARRFDIFHLVVCAHEGDSPVEIKRAGGAAIACAGQDGKYAGQAFLSASPGWKVESVKYVSLGEAFAEDPAVLQLKRAYLDRVAAEDLLSLVPRTPFPNGDTFAGSAACASCHSGVFQVWQSSAHAKAMETLANSHEDKDPECVPCHAVGLDKTGGFVSRERTPHLQDVGCESCHGAASRHAQDPATSMPKTGSDSCLPCHNARHSPSFDFDKYWAAIRH